MDRAYEEEDEEDLDLLREDLCWLDELELELKRDLTISFIFIPMGSIHFRKEGN